MAQMAQLVIRSWINETAMLAQLECSVSVILINAVGLPTEKGRIQKTVWWQIWEACIELGRIPSSVLRFFNTNTTPYKYAHGDVEKIMRNRDMWSVRDVEMKTEGERWTGVEAYGIDD